MTEAAATKKKRGRPRKKLEGGHLHYSPPSPPRPATAPRRTLRPRRRRTLLDDFADFDDYLDEEEEEVVVEEQERKGKRRKLKLILKLPLAGPTTATTEEERPRRGAPVVPASSFSSLVSSSSYVDDDDDDDDDDEEVEEAEGETMKPLKKRRLEGCDDGVRSVGSGDREVRFYVVLRCFVLMFEQSILFKVDGVSFLSSGVSTSSQVAGTCMPERKLLEAVLDKIQK
ncbi:hypothetical protein BHM03_00016594 [Ensete ventricosum]|nr:hypothetical protein BHM03_00016594 [Ensete ventricosum]